MSRKAANRLLKSLLRNLKNLNIANSYDDTQKYRFRLILPEVLSQCQQDKAHFDLEYVEDLKKRTVEIIEDLRALKEAVEQNFTVQLEAGKEESFFLELELTGYESSGYWNFQIDPKVCQINVQVNPYLVKFPLKVRSFFPVSEDFRTTTTSHMAAKECFLKVIDASIRFYERKVKEYEERVKFLKQPIKSYGQLTEPVSSIDNGIPRYQMFQKWENEFIDALGEIFEVSRKDVSPGQIEFSGILFVKKDDQDDVTNKLKGVEKLKKLVSHFPDVANRRVAFFDNDLFFFTSTKCDGVSSYRSTISVEFPETCTLVDKAGRNERVNLFSNDDRPSSFIECLNHLEKFLKQRLREAQALNAKKEIAARQTRERKMIM